MQCPIRPFGILYGFRFTSGAFASPMGLSNILSPGDAGRNEGFLGLAEHPNVGHEWRSHAEGEDD